MISYYKKYLKAHGLRIVIKKPILLFYLPIIIISTLINRFQKDETSIYLVEMQTSEKNYDISLDYHTIINTDYLSDFIHNRAIEDSEINEQIYRLEIDKRLKNGHKIYSIIDKNKIISILFVAFKNCYISSINYNLVIPDHIAGIYDVYTLLDYRGKKFYRNLFCYCVNDLFNNGYKCVWLWLMQHNDISVISHLKLGMRNVIKKITLSKKFFNKKIIVEDNFFDLSLLIK